MFLFLWVILGTMIISAIWLNKGVELELNYIPVNKKDFTWKINLNLTHYKNKITYLPE